MASQVFPNVPQDHVGAMVQNAIDAGAKRVTVTPNGDGTCTVVVED